MATTPTLIDGKGKHRRIWDVTVDAADPVGTFAHGLGYTPTDVSVTPNGPAGPFVFGPAPSGALTLVALTGTTVTFTKTPGVPVSFRLALGRNGELD